MSEGDEFLEDEEDTEFQSLSGADDETSDEELGDWGGEELEAAYLKAMSALEASDLQLPSVSAEQPRASVEEIAAAASVVQNTESATSPMDAVQDATAGETTEELLQELFTARPVEAAAAPEAPPVESRVTPRQIIEACLFVGGSALTSKKLCGVLRDEFDSDFVDREIDELNRQYAVENRPYEIRLGDGGYRLTLRSEFERIRHKAYGLGPKEVRLSQEALEVLAVVAYHQPIKQSRVEELGKPGCGSVLRQLVRRELLAVERDPAHPREIHYKTTPRFLTLFGIRNLDELPQHDQVSYK